jgi:hypothetical protein
VSDTPVAHEAWQARHAAPEKRIPELMHASHVPGLDIAIVRDAGLLWHRD